MNVKNNIKKVSAVLASAALVATTLVGAMAYDLSDYPAPFVENGMAKGAIVVGANAATQDVIGAIDIAASLQAEAKSMAAASGTTVAVEGAEDFNLAANAAYAGGTFDDADLEGFADSDAELEDTDYDYHEEIVIDANGVEIRTSVDTTYAEEDDYGLDAWMEATAGAIRYRIVFDDVVPIADFGTADDNQEMEIDFLGKKITIADADGADGITVEASAEYYMQEGDTVTIEGHEVTLIRVGSSSVLVRVDGQTLAVETSEEFDQADDFEVEVVSQFYIEGADDNSATLKLGTAISQSYTDGEALEIFDGEDDADESTWRWHIVDNGTHLSEIGAELNIDFERSNDDNDPEKRAAIPFGSSLDFPNGYAAIEFAGWEDSAMAKYDSLDFEFDVVDLDVNADEPVLKITSSAEDAFEMDDGNDASVVWLEDSVNGNFWYEDGDDEVDSGAATMDFVLDNDVVSFTYNGSHLIVATPGVVDTLVLDIAATFDYFGATDGEAEAADLAFTDANGATFSGTEDEDQLSSYGLKFEDVENQLDNDELTVWVPHDGLDAEIVVKSSGSVVSSASSGNAYNVNPIALGLGILDTDAPALGSKPMIIVGGPAANTVAAEFMGNPTAEEIAATFSEGKALIRYNDDNMAMLVAGWGAMETQGAANVVAKYGMYDFEGTELEVVVTDLSNVQVNSVN